MRLIFPNSFTRYSTNIWGGSLPNEIYAHTIASLLGLDHFCVSSKLQMLMSSFFKSLRKILKICFVVTFWGFQPQSKFTAFCVSPYLKIASAVSTILSVLGRE